MSRAMQQPLFSFGMVADIQYGDFETRGNYRFRDVPDKLRGIIDAFNRQELAFVVQLGDIVEGNGEKTHQELDLILSILSASKHRLVHIVGNHCLSAGLAPLLKKLHLDSPYYDFSHQGFRFIALYGMGISAESPKDSAEYAIAKQFLAENTWAREWCGMIDEAQFRWLKTRLSDAAHCNEKVILFNHFPATTGTTSANHGVMWNYAELQNVIAPYKNVVAHLNGHYHHGGYEQAGGVHYISLEALVESPEKDGAFAVVDVFEDKMRVRGFGSASRYDLAFPQFERASAV